MHAVFSGLYLRNCVASRVLDCHVTTVEARGMGRGSVYGIYLQSCSFPYAATELARCNVHNVRALGDGTNYAAGIALVDCEDVAVAGCGVSRVDAPRAEFALGLATALCARVTFDACAVTDVGVRQGLLRDRRRFTVAN